MEDYIQIKNDVINYLEFKASENGKDYTSWCSLYSILESLSYENIDLEKLCIFLKSEPKICFLEKKGKKIEPINLKIKKRISNDEVVKEIINVLKNNKPNKERTNQMIYSLISKIGISKGHDISLEEYEELEKYLIKSKYFICKDGVSFGGTNFIYLEINEPMSFFGYELGASYPPPIQYPDFYTKNLEPQGDLPISSDLKIDLSTSGRPYFYISKISASLYTESQKDHENMVKFVIFHLVRRGFEITGPLTLNEQNKCIFNKGCFKGKMTYDLKASRDGYYFFHFFVENLNIDSKELFG